MDKKPKVWKMMLISWLFVYPVINLMFFLIFPLIKELPQIIKDIYFYGNFSSCYGNGNSCAS